MRRLMGILVGLAPVLVPAAAWAEGAGGGYRGIAQIYYSFIAAVLIYGVHDTFKNRNVTIAGAVVIVVALFGFLLPKT